VIRITILGEPYSKSNTSQVVMIGDRYSIGKSKEAKAYIRMALPQIPPAARLRLEVPLRMTLRIYYANARRDLDESQILDLLQDQWKRDRHSSERVLVQAGVYRNDRQVVERHAYRLIDARNPRAEIEIEPLEAVQASLMGDV
jgi:Holliday junction resolvase RusA-like endonuclease